MLLKIIYAAIAFFIQLQFTIQKESNTHLSEEQVNLTILPRKEFIHLNYGDAINVRCIVSSNITNGYRIEWSRSKNQPLPSQAVQIDGILHIYPASMKDSDFYTCSAISKRTGNVLRETKIQIVMLQINEKYVAEMAGKYEKPTIDGVIVKRLREEEAKKTTLNISCIGSNDEFNHVTWRRVNDSLPFNSKIIGNQLQISNINVNDQGIYICELLNNTSESAIVLLYYFLIVQKPEAPSVEIQTIQGNKIDPVVNFYEPVTINCIITKGEPKPNISWSRYQYRMDTVHTFVSPLNDSLMIPEIMEVEHSTNQHYFCHAINSIGKDSQVTVLEFEFESRKAVQISFYPDLNEYFVIKGGRVWIECTAEGYPLPTVSWLDALPTYNSTSHAADENTITRTAVLEIENYQYSDPAYFVCVAQNSNERVERMVFMSMIDNPDYIRKKPAYCDRNFRHVCYSPYLDPTRWEYMNKPVVTYTHLRDSGNGTYFSPNDTCMEEGSHYPPYTIEKDFEISIEIKACRNADATGVLFLACSDYYFLLLEIVNNTVKLTSGGSRNPFPAVTVLYLRRENYFNDGRWHTIRTAKRNEIENPLFLTVDEDLPGIKFNSFNYSDRKSNMFLGGLCYSIFNLQRKSYVGCMRNLKIHGERFDLTWFRAFRHPGRPGRNECPF